MANRFDHRDSPEVRRLIRRLPSMKHVPLVGAFELREIDKVFNGLPDLEFPINSASELIEKLGGADQMLEIEGMEINPLRMIKYMPAYYFPIPNCENFVEKMAELVRQNRSQVDVPRDLVDVKRQLPDLKFPIRNGEELLKMVGTAGRYEFRGRVVNPEIMLKRVPRDFFPLESQDDFDTKVTRLLMPRPLIVPD